MEENIKQLMLKFEEQQIRLDQIYRSVEKTRKYFLWTMILTVLTIVLPMIGLAFAIPALMSSLNVSGLGL